MVPLCALQILMIFVEFKPAHIFVMEMEYAIRVSACAFPDMILRSIALFVILGAHRLKVVLVPQLKIVKKL
jgi:hypothetical protein